MTGEERFSIKRKVDRRDHLNQLLKTDAFQALFIDYYLKEELNEMIYREGSSPGVMVELDARKAFNDFLYNIIDSGNQAEQILKGN